MNLIVTMDTRANGLETPVQYLFMLPSTPTIKMAVLLDDDDLSIDKISLLEGELDESTEFFDEEEVELNVEPVAC